MTDCVIVGRYNVDGKMHVAAIEAHDCRAGMASVRLYTWCGGSLPIRYEVRPMTVDEALEVVSCSNCRHSLVGGLFPLAVMSS